MFISLVEKCVLLNPQNVVEAPSERYKLNDMEEDFVSQDQRHGARLRKNPEAVIAQRIGLHRQNLIEHLLGMTYWESALPSYLRGRRASDYSTELNLAVPCCCS